MVQIFHIIKWEFINRIKTKLFIFTTFVLPILIGGMTYLPTILIDLEPENSTNVGLVYSDDISLLVKRFQNPNLFWPYLKKWSSTISIY